MYCVIQEIENKKYNNHGANKKLEVYTNTWSSYGQTKTSYSYTFTGERFKRPIRKAYKISIHKSYRDKGKVKKKQWTVCTMGYYDLLEFSIYDCVIESKLKEKVIEMDLDYDEFWNMVYDKINPLIKSIENEFKTTEEYKTHKKHKDIINKYLKDKADFEKIYGDNTYDYCYDVFGELRNKEYLEKVEREYKAQREYKSSYWENFRSNYDFNSFSSYYGKKQSNYTEKEKQYLKTIYKAGALKLHPDKTKDSGEGMKFLNKLKEQWGI